MVDYRDNYDTRADLHYPHERGRSSSIGPLIALGVIVVLIAGVFLLSSGADNVDINAGSPAPVVTDTAPAAPAVPATE
mgnify:CR=1 FL=1